MYPFSIWIDEHVPLNMGAGSIFFQEGTNNGFSRVGPKIFCRGEQKWQNYILTTGNLENNFFAKKVDGKCQISKSWRALAPPSDTHAPKTSFDKKAEEDIKNIFINKHMMTPQERQPTGICPGVPSLQHLHL